MQIKKDRIFTKFGNRTKTAHGIIIHSIAEKLEGEQGDSIDFLEKIGLSAHYFITPEAEVYETLPTDKVAFHAGKSEWDGESGLNETYIGIEVMVPGTHNYASFLEAIKNPDSFSEAQYRACATLCYRLIKRHSEISYSRILRHSQVSGKQVRPDPKKDPGAGWDQERLIRKIRSEFSGMI